LYKAVYLQHFDEPSNEDFDYEQALKQAVQLEMVCSRRKVGQKVCMLGPSHHFSHWGHLSLRMPAVAANGSGSDLT
jgi:hypothetical protein